MTPITILANCQSVSYGQNGFTPMGNQTSNTGTTATVSFNTNSANGVANGVTVAPITLQFQNVTSDLGFFPGSVYTLTIQ